MPTRRPDGTNVIHGFDSFGDFAIAAKEYSNGTFQKYDVVTDKRSGTIYRSINGSPFDRLGEITDRISVDDIEHNGLMQVLKVEKQRYEDEINKDLAWR